MDYEKKYNEALKEIRELISLLKKNDVITDNGIIESNLQRIFPELAESEDERIRKEIIEFLQNTLIKRGIKDGKDKAVKWIAYLEKQKESTWTEEDESFRKYTLPRILNPTGWTMEQQKEADRERLKEFVERQKNKWIEKQKEQKPEEWSFPYGVDETVDELIAIAECLEMDGDCLFNDYTGTECGKFLRDLARKQVECKPAEWSEEDEKNIGSIAAHLDSILDCSNATEAIKITKEIAWLKSLRPSWKPSEEQMEALHTAAYLPEMEFYGGLKDKLRELYTQLKKLI